MVVVFVGMLRWFLVGLGKAEVEWFEVFGGQMLRVLGGGRRGVRDLIGKIVEERILFL